MGDKISKAEIKHYEKKMAEYLAKPTEERAVEVIRLWKSRHRNVMVKGAAFGLPTAGKIGF